MTTSERWPPVNPSPAGGSSLSCPPPVPWDGVLTRVRASAGARRLVPTGLARVGTDLLYQLMPRLSSDRMAAARASMDAVVGATPAKSEVSRLARNHMAAQARIWELTWRPWELAQVPIPGTSRIQRARAAARSLVVSIPHRGPLVTWVPLARLLRPLYAPAVRWILGYNGYQVEHQLKLFREAGTELIRASGSARTLIRMLASGGCVHLAMDVPGSRWTQYLGKPGSRADGTARLTAKADALVVPVGLMPLGRRWEIQVGNTLDPCDFSSPDQLHLALAAIPENFVMRAPDHLESPLRPGRWARVTDDGWYRK